MWNEAGNSIAVLVDRRTGQEFNISRYSVSIGREIGNDIVVITDKTISRQHALIQYVNGKFHVQDLSSKNGTRLNGGLIGAMTELKSGDEVACGLTQFIFMLKAENRVGEPIRAAITEGLPDSVVGRTAVNK
ncbi:MAG: FHA domain-containing protein [Candidatus Obscuribacterales bacterium]|nr:FHA domain-containing protein [Candidatus Obscuribacterales bacterium]